MKPTDRRQNYDMTYEEALRYKKSAVLKCDCLVTLIHNGENKKVLMHKGDKVDYLMTVGRNYTLVMVQSEATMNHPVNLAITKVDFEEDVL